MLLIMFLMIDRCRRENNNTYSISLLYPR